MVKSLLGSGLGAPLEEKCFPNVPRDNCSRIPVKTWNGAKPKEYHWSGLNWCFTFLVSGWAQMTFENHPCLLTPTVNLSRVDDSLHLLPWDHFGIKIFPSEIKHHWFWVLVPHLLIKWFWISSSVRLNDNRTSLIGTVADTTGVKTCNDLAPCLARSKCSVNVSSFLNFHSPSQKASVMTSHF